MWKSFSSLPPVLKLIHRQCTFQTAYCLLTTRTYVLSIARNQLLSGKGYCCRGISYWFYWQKFCWLHAISCYWGTFNKHRHASHTKPIRIYKPTYITTLWPGQVTCDLSRRVETPGRVVGAILYKCVQNLVLYRKKTVRWLGSTNPSTGKHDKIKYYCHQDM